MADALILYGGQLLLNGDGTLRIYDTAIYPAGPPAECCCREPCDFPATLYGTLTSKTGYATALPDNLTFTQISPGIWDVDTGTNCGFGSNNFNLVCTGDNEFVLQSGANNITPFVGVPPDPTPSFSPLLLTFTVSGSFGCGAMSYVLTITE